MQLKGLEGIGLGSQHPDLTEKLWTQSMEQIDEREWAATRSYGLDIPDHPPQISLEEQERELLIDLAEWLSHQQPELLNPLNLKPPEE